MTKILLPITLMYGIAVASNYSNGEALYFQKACASCHGNKAEGLHNFPKLANQKAYKLRNKLLAYKADQVKTPQASVMTSYAKNLEENEMNDIIEYLSNYKHEEPEEYYDNSYEEWGDGGS